MQTIGLPIQDTLAMKINNLHVRLGTMVEEAGTLARNLGYAFPPSATGPDKSQLARSSTTHSAVLGDGIELAIKLCALLDHSADEVGHARDDNSEPSMASDTLLQRAQVLCSHLRMANLTIHGIADGVGCVFGDRKDDKNEGPKAETFSSLIDDAQIYLSAIEQSIGNLLSFCGNVNGDVLPMKVTSQYASVR